MAADPPHAASTPLSCRHRTSSLAAATPLSAASAGPNEVRAAPRRVSKLPAATSAAVPARAPSTATTPPIASDPHNADCGPRALLLLCQKLGVKTDLQTLRQTAGTTAQGTTLSGLQQAAQKLGLQAEGVQVSRDALPDTALPALAWMHRDHYVALLSLSGSGDTATATIHDPNKPGEETLSQEQLLQRCGGYLLLVHR